MNFGIYATFFLLSMVKFLFTPFGGPAAKLSFFETYFSCVTGGVFSAGVFYFASEFFMKLAHNRKIKKQDEAIANGVPLTKKKIFTKTNKKIVALKHKLGIYGITFFAPLFLSVPIGTAITAKFYGKEKKTFPLIVLGMFVNGLVTTGLAYLIASFF